MRAPSSPLCSLLALSWLGSCAPVGQYVWVDQYRPPPSGEEAYLLGPGDVVGVRVLGQEAMSAKARVRTDGRISLPFLDEVEAVGMTPGHLAEVLRERFKTVVSRPVVSVALEEPRPFTVSVVGEVARPGVYVLEPRSGVLHALASAGGLSQYAHQDRVFVLRRLEPGSTERIRFDFRRLARAEGTGAHFSLGRNDVVVVE